MRIAQQPEPRMCQVLLGLVAACPAWRVLPALAGGALALCREQMLWLTATAALHPHPKCSGSLTPNISLPEHPWQGCSPPSRGQRLCHQTVPEAWQGGGKAYRLGDDAGAGAQIALSGAESS